MPEQEEYEDENPKLKGSLFRKFKSFSSARKKQKDFEKKIFQKAYKAELRKSLEAKSATKAQQIVAQAQRAAQNKAEGYGRVIARKFGAGALRVGKGFLIGGKRAAPHVKKGFKFMAKKAVEASD